MFTTNQIYFAIFFIVFFSIAIIISYSKDKKNHKLIINEIQNFNRIYCSDFNFIFNKILWKIK